jgi:hypothetical protein
VKISTYSHFPQRKKKEAKKKERTTTGITSYPGHKNGLDKPDHLNAIPDKNKPKPQKATTILKKNNIR